MKTEQNNNPSNFINLLTNSKLKLQGRIQGPCIELILAVDKDNTNKIFQCIVNTEEISQLKNLFQNNQGLFQFLKDAANIGVDQQKANVILYGRHPIKKAETVELYKIALIEKTFRTKENFEDIINHCNKQENIEGPVLKSILKSIVQKIQQISNQGRGPEELQRVGRKIENLGNQLQSVKMKTADLLQKNQSLRRIAATQQEYIVELKENNLKVKQFLYQQIDKYDNKIKKLHEILKDQEIKIKELSGIIEFGRINESKVVKYKQQDLEEQRNNEIQTMKLLEKSAKFLKHFVVRGLNVTKQDDFIFPTILIGSRPIRIQNEYTLKISKMGILKKIYPGVCVGIVDSKHKHKQSCDNGDNVIQFSCAGKLFQSNKYIRTESSGFEQGDILKVKVNFETSVITWYVNDVAKCNFMSKLLQNPDIDWRPYIFMRDKGDSVDWILK